ncbi:MAG: DMT family transporter [Acidobacteriota bacterium]|nr:DMT family transporter [Acidobacteriota bacterium]
MTAYLLAVLSSIAYGSADFLGGLATKRGAPLVAVVVLSQLTGLILIVLALPFLPASSPSAIDIAWGAAAGLAGGIGVALLYRALSVGVMSVVAPVTAVCAVIVPLVVGVALGERPAPRAIVGVILAIVAIALVSQSGEKRAAAGVATAIASGVIIGFFLVFLARSGPSAGMWPLITARVVSVSFFVLSGLLTRNKIAPPRESMPIVIGGGTLDMVANILYVLAVRRGPLSIIATLTSLYPTSTIILARIVLRERLRAVQQSGVFCAGLAIVLIVTSS